MLCHGLERKKIAFFRWRLQARRQVLISRSIEGAFLTTNHPIYHYCIISPGFGIVVSISDDSVYTTQRYHTEFILEQCWALEKRNIENREKSIFQRFTPFFMFIRFRPLYASKSYRSSVVCSTQRARNWKKRIHFPFILAFNHEEPIPSRTLSLK